MSRNTWRGIFIGIIILTIPCYLFGIFVYQSNSGGLFSPPTQTLTPSWTPINLTQLAIENPSLVVTNPPPTPIPSATSLDLNITPILPTGITPIFSPTVPPTRFVSATPTLFVPPTNTQFVPPSSTPTATQPILLPPTDTPNP
ncbi:MAG: hypothetical protein AAF846_04015 [Chloroflexota bacterium]